MPIYEYICDDCQARYERLVLSSNHEAVTCPQCGSTQAIQQFSSFSSPKSNSSNGSVSSGAGCACTPRSCGCK